MNACMYVMVMGCALSALEFDYFFKEVGVI